eukprot:CAMPEP_0115880598 /NCGR_PEP_ID=MMETSP0287-20121206/27965_1 /TAXON_ID=412157 /ORGANISM="Chrysochromulina rotalis, Strain UIO044" /LENGTH=81 /DNA_ID=CAMNT_0003336437 /DNA_START=16 /DNA_END=258 /DNA_ORIENTATION=+
MTWCIALHAAARSFQVSTTSRTTKPPVDAEAVRCMSSCAAAEEAEVMPSGLTGCASSQQPNRSSSEGDADDRVDAESDDDD